MQRKTIIIPRDPNFIYIVRKDKDFRCSSCSSVDSDICEICTPTQGGFGCFHKSLEPENKE